MEENRMLENGQLNPLKRRGLYKKQYPVDGSYLDIPVLQKQDYDKKKTCSFCFLQDIRAGLTYDLALSKDGRISLPCEKKKLKSMIEDQIEQGRTHFLVDAFYDYAEPLSEVLAFVRGWRSIMVEAVMPSVDYIRGEHILYHFDRVTAVSETMGASGGIGNYKKTIADLSGVILAVFYVPGVGVQAVEIKNEKEL